MSRRRTHLGFRVRPLDIEQRPWRLRVAESDFAKRALDDERLVLRARFRCFDSASDLLLHPLDVVVAAAWVMPASAVAVAAACLEQVGLRELAQWLSRPTTRRDSNLCVDLVVEVLGQLLFAARLVVHATSCCEQLLQLDARDEVLVLRGHEAVVLAEKEDLVVAFRSLGFFGEICLALVRMHVHHLLGLSDWWAVVRCSTVVGHRMHWRTSMWRLDWWRARWHRYRLLT